MLVVLAVLGIARVVAGREFTDAEYFQLPRLYSLDSREACLARRGGLYCVGTFRMQPPPHNQHDPLYNLVQEYSANPYHFNRTLVHRGYCVSERCRAPERNHTRRFERCAAAVSPRLRLTLHRLHYCRSHAVEYARRHSPEPVSLPARLLLAVTLCLLLLVAIGTLYDVLGGDKEKKNDLVAVWSVRSNWRRLTASYEDGDPHLAALTPVQGVRVFLMLLIIGTHAACIHDMLYLYNPRYVEQAAKSPYLMAFMNGTSVVMVFVLVSSFLLTYNLLLLSRQHPLHTNMLKWCIIKRVARISPVSVLVVWFAGWAWGSLGEGPMWPLLVEVEAARCRTKLWAQVFYFNNLWRADEHCFVQTWFLATDMQLYIVCAALTLWLAHKRVRALPVLCALTAASCVLNGALAYYFDWKSLMYYVYPQTMHTMYSEVASFSQLYTAPWGSLPAALLGLILAHTHFQLHERNIRIIEYAWFRRLYTVTPLGILCWLLAGYWLRTLTAPWFTALYVAVERPVLSIMSAIILLGLFNGMQGFLQRYFSWSGWHAMGRMSLSVLMVHWMVNTCVAASRPQPIATSLLQLLVDAVSTAVFSYIIAIPLTLVVEMPFTRTVNVIIANNVGKLKKET